MAARDDDDGRQHMRTTEDTRYFVAPPLRNAAADLQSQPIVEPVRPQHELDPLASAVNVDAAPYLVGVDSPTDGVHVLPSRGSNIGARERAEAEQDSSPFKLADFISSDPDLAIFRRFDRVTAHTLLIQQRELQDAETELMRAQRDDPFVADDSQQTPQALQRRAGRGDGHAARRIDLEAQLKWCLKEYQEALLRSAKILELEAPRTATRRALETWIGHTYEPNANSDASAMWMPYFPSLPHAKVERSTPLDRFLARDDLLALRTPPDQDRLTELLEGRFAQLLKPRWRQGHGTRTHPSTAEKQSKVSDGQSRGGADTQGVFYYPEQRLRLLVSLASLLLSVFLLVGAIVALYFIGRNDVKLVLLVVFTLLFALTVGLCTNAKRSEVFASTAGYAAVLVVFLGGNFHADSNS